MSIFLSLAIAGAAWFSLCLAILLVKYGIPPSLSESYYNLGGKDGKGYLFYIMLAVTVFLMAAPMCAAAGGWGFLCALGLLFVGAAPAFNGQKNDGKDDGSLDMIIHPLSAIVCAACSVLTLWRVHIAWIDLITLAVSVILALLTKTIKKSYVFWLEMAAFYGLFAGVIVHFLKV